MAKKRWKKQITRDEYMWLWEHGYVINHRWIGPKEGYVYMLALKGSTKNLHYAKSPRALYNRARKIEDTKNEI